MRYTVGKVKRVICPLHESVDGQVQRKGQIGEKGPSLVSIKDLSSNKRDVSLTLKVTLEGGGERNLPSVNESLFDRPFSRLYSGLHWSVFYL